jgi:hypothetical protein
VETEAAINECAAVHGHLPTAEQYATAVLAGAPNGSSANGGQNNNSANPFNANGGGAWMHTADATYAAYDAVIMWGGTSTTFDWNVNWTGTSASWVSYEGRYPFRCMGYNTSVAPAAIPATDGYTDTDLPWRFDGHDQSPINYPLSIDDCITRGGHLPRVHEIGKAVLNGLPNGTNATLYTSDEVGYSPSSSLVAELQWTGTSTSFNFYSPGDGSVSWAWKNVAVAGPYAHRCIYYPVDSSYAGPASSTCEGSTCFKLTVGGRSHIWIDNFDKPAASYQTAFQTCAAKGGRLASERDLTEAARNGLPNGSSKNLWTSDLVSGNPGQASYLLVGCPYWTGTGDKTMNDYWGSNTSWCGYIYNPANTQPYRCTWTDELR